MTEVIYLGSFDPFHYGHKEIVDYLLLNGYTVNILLSPCTNSKQNKTNIDHRKNIIKCYFNVTQKVNIEFADTYLEKTNTDEMIGIMGSDAYNCRVIKQKIPKIHLKKWLIVTRNDETCLPNTLNNFDVEFLDQSLFKLQHTSSTVIRGTLKNNCRDSVPEDVYEYCKIFGLYNDSNIQSKFVDRKANYAFVHTNDKTIGIKLFFDENDKFMNEINGYNHLSDKLNIVQPMSTFSGNMLQYITYEKINGISIKHLLQLATQEKIYQIGIMVGKVLRAFHNLNNMKFTLRDIETNPIIEKIGKQHFEEILSKYNKCYLHGDMSINNVCYDESCDEIYFIDPEKSMKYVDGFGHPSGISYYEYQQFLSSIDFYSQSDNTCEANQHLKNGFVEGYGNINKCNAINDYWHY